MKIIPFIAVFFLLLSSCSKKENQSAIDDQIINNYLTSNKISATKDPSGLYYVTTLVGTGASPVASSTVVVKYKGSLINGTVFYQTPTDKTFTYLLSGLIKGWQIGIPLMKKGGKTTFYIPSELGYGATNQGIIPPNSVLVFDIELVEVQ